MNDHMIEQINRLRKEKNAVILAHTYQTVDIQSIADFTGDSLQLSIQASQVKADFIVFCGVRFMAETAAMLNPAAKVLLPAADAGCPMADMVSAEDLRKYRAEHPDAVIVCYVNSTAEVKAESDICCTSSNAVRVVSSIPMDKKILFVPDQNLGSWAARKSGRQVELWDGYCPIHHWGFEVAQIKALRKKYPDHSLIAHPECDEGIVDAADAVMSTSGMMQYVADHDKVIIATEVGLTDALINIYPQKSLIPLNPKAICKNMKKTTMQHVLDALEKEQHHITVPQDVAARAIHSLNRMLELSR